MKIINLTREQPSTINYSLYFALNLENSKEIWLFNCHQGCQHELQRNKIKINHISKIIITSLSIENISGLLGLLSSLSLTNRNRKLDIYSPQGLQYYLKLGQKYSQTNFRYNVYLHILTTGLIINQHLHQAYAFSCQINSEFLIISQEKFGKFRLIKARRFYLIEGPLYGKLKKGHDLLLPDGLILNSDIFTYSNIPGIKVYFMSHTYNERKSIEISQSSKILNYST